MAQQLRSFKAGISDAVNTVLAWYMARDAGFYAAQGLKVDIINMNGGSRGARGTAGRPHRRHACRPVLGDPASTAPAATCG